MNRRDFIAGCGAFAASAALGRPIRSAISSTETGAIDSAAPTAASYIQDGLTNLLDGIENVGLGSHDPDSSFWLDLVSGDSLSFNKGDNIYFTNNALHREAALGELRTHIPFPLSNTTVEVVCDVQGPQDFNSNPRIIGTRASYRFEVDAFNGQTTSLRAPRIYGRLSKGSYSQTYGDFNRTPFGFWSLTCLFSEDDVIILDSVCGKMKSTTFDSAFYEGGLQTLNLGAWYRTSGAMTGDFFSVRCYDRVLTTDEIAFNHKIDEARFLI